MKKHPTKVEMLADRAQELLDQGMTEGEVRIYLKENPPYYTNQRVSEALIMLGVRERIGHTKGDSESVESFSRDILEYVYSRKKPLKLSAASLSRAYHKLLRQQKESDL